MSSLAQRLAANAPKPMSFKGGTMNKNLFAYTELTHEWPGYASLNVQRGEPAKLSVRSPGNGGKDYAQVQMPDEQLRALADSINEYLKGK